VGGDATASTLTIIQKGIPRSDKSARVLQKRLARGLKKWEKGAKGQKKGQKATLDAEMKSGKNINGEREEGTFAKKH